MKKFLIALCFILLITYFIPLPIYADNNFVVSFDTQYTINENGTTHVVFNGVLQNATDTLYADFYTIQIGFTNIDHVKAFDSKGNISAQIKKIDNGVAITIPFNSHAYGLNKNTTFSLSFDTTDVAKHTGNIWEVNIPGLANQTDFKDFTVHVKVPPSFGKPAYVKPLIQADSLYFDKESLGASGVSLAFGTTQVYDFSLNYQLKNDNLFPVTTEIALPPSTNYQEITMHDISPKPENIRVDTDGNWLATYYLFPSQKTTVIVKGSAYVELIPKQERITSLQKKIYTQPQPFWETQNPEIAKLAADLKTPDNIYQYVVHHLQYDVTRVAGQQQRVGAANVLQHPTSAVCLEFTDLFIALARAAGIPTREIDGFAYTQNKEQRPLSLEKDVLHAWPEYYNSTTNTWIMVDPTWENTTKGIDYFHTLDFDHLAFIIKGQSSLYPVPPGGYKYNQEDTTKNVFVSFGKFIPLQSPQVTWSFDIPPVLFSGFPIKGNLVFKNISDRIVPPEVVNVSAVTLLPHSQTILSDPIPPFSEVTLPVRLRSTSFLTNAKEIITIRVAGNTITKKISVYPFFYQRNYLIGSIISVIFCIGLFIIASKARSVSFFRRKR